VAQVAQRSCGCHSLEVFKVRLDEALSNWCSGNCPCPWQRGFALGDFLRSLPTNFL